MAVALLVFITGAGGWVLWNYGGPGPAAREGAATTVVLPRGAGVAEIARRLAESGVIRSRRVFVAAARLSGAAARLKAGEYAFRSRAPMASVLEDVRAGRVVRHLVRIPEGWTSRMAVEAVRRQPVLAGDTPFPPEGSLLPDTYLVQRGETRAAVVARMQAAQGELMAEIWPRRAAGLPFATREEAVILASLVEKETALPVERPRIAAVFVNRLRAGMRLESDPTIIYGMTQGRPLGRSLTAAEVRTPSPYNTYLIPALPPTPIANPGRESLKAVLNPPRTDELFFVADGRGGHAFASTFAEHRANIGRWLAGERARAAQK